MEPEPTTNAVHAFQCGVCHAQTPIDDGAWDNELHADVCKDCQQQLRWAQAWLKHAQMPHVTYERNIKPRNRA